MPAVILAVFNEHVSILRSFNFKSVLRSAAVAKLLEWVVQ